VKDFLNFLVFENFNKWIDLFKEKNVDNPIFFFRRNLQ